MVDPIILAEDLSKSYQAKQVSLFDLKNINLAIYQGDFAIIMGPSGSGKSTLLNLIGALDKPTSGTLKIANNTLNASVKDEVMAKYRQEIVGFIFQSFYLIPNLSVIENIYFPLWLMGVNKKLREQKAHKLLDEVGLNSKLASKSINKLSGGEKQRVAIARALINDPQIILADEPTGNLDSRTGELVIDLLKNLNRSGKTIIMVTHDDKYRLIGNHFYYILDGELVHK